MIGEKMYKIELTLHTIQINILKIGRLVMKMIMTASILILCLAVNLLVSVEFVPGEMSVVQASETYGGGCCVDDGQKACHETCSESGNHKTCVGATSGSDDCTTLGSGACGDCLGPDSVSLTGVCP